MPGSLLDMIESLDHRFRQEADPGRAAAMSKYMLNQFPFFGIPSPARKTISRPMYRGMKPSREELVEAVNRLWQKEEREFQYVGMELADRFHRVLEPADAEWLGTLITGRSWWDTVDFLAAHPVGDHLKRFPDMIPALNRKWMGSGNIWLQRTCLLFQLGYREQTDTDLLFRNILACASSNEFFLRKAIGWSLRQYAKVNPAAVMDFVNEHPLSPLSVREALKGIRKQGQGG